MKRSVRTVALLILGWLGLTFLLRDPLHYLIDHSPESFGRFWPNRPWLLLHIVGGTVALLAGPFQFWSRIRTKLPRVHRVTGRLYIAGILLATLPSFYLAFFAETVSFAIALLALAIAWLYTTGMAFAAIRRRDITRHRAWMMRSYIVTFAFVTFRTLGLLPIWSVFGDAREAAAGWASWLLPMLVFEVVLRRRKRAARAAAPRLETA